MKTDTPFNGLGMSLGALPRLSHAKTRSISAENPDGAKGAGALADPAGKGAARDLGVGWKVRPCVSIDPGETFPVADIQGPGAIQHIWMTAPHPRFSILRFYWDDEATPSIEAPVGAFFGNVWGVFARLSSLPVCYNPGSGMNCWWEMPFRKRCRITLENLDTRPTTLFYQVDYTLTDVPDDVACLHAQFRRSNPVVDGVHTILDGVEGQGHYVGTVMGWGVRNNGWWGEGEIKFFLDGDHDAPTLCGTGTEDYFLGSYNFDPASANHCTFGDKLGEANRYEVFNTPWSGLFQVIRPDGVYNTQQRFGLYRWHVMDPIRFERDLRVTIQDLGWRSDGRYLVQSSEIASVAFWYQAEPHAPFPAFPDHDMLEIH
ncbi:MAG: glycoside hydrolase family 172 protein [Kiritimatiellia bacterium]|jgi:hypothetical protein